MVDYRRAVNKPQNIVKKEAKRIIKTLEQERNDNNEALMEPLIKGLQNTIQQQKLAQTTNESSDQNPISIQNSEFSKLHGNPTILDPSLTPPGVFSSPFVDRPLNRFYYRQTDGVQLPYLPQSYYDIYWLANMDLIIRDSINKLTGEIFREGILIEEAFWGKCDSCEEPFETKPFEAVDLTNQEFHENGLSCPDCKGGTIRPPDKDQKKFLTGLLERVNNNGQTFQAVAEEVNRDFEIADDGYVVLLKDYDLEEDGTITATFREMIRGDPSIMRISANNRSEIGTVQFTCLFHRNFIAINPEGRCDQCDSDVLFPVHYVATRLGARDIEQAYIAGEVIHDIKYNKSLLYGYPPILSMWYYALSDTNMIKYIAMYFDHRRKPNGIIAIPGQWQMIKKMMQDWRTETLRDPFFIPTVAIPPETTGKPEFIQFMDSLKEADYVSVRDELRLRMAAFYGVSPVMQGDLSQGGGLNNEGLQFKVTDRAAERGQGLWNDVKHAIGMFTKILKELAITDWKLVLQKPDEEDRVAPIDRLAKRLDNAKKWQEMGGIVQLPEDGLTDENDFLFLGEPFVKPDPATQQGFGGGFGGGGDGSVSPQRPGSPSSGEKPGDSDKPSDENEDENANDQAQETTTPEQEVVIHEHEHKHGDLVHAHSHSHPEGSAQRHNHGRENLGEDLQEEEKKSLQKADPLDLFGEGFTDRLIAFFRNALLINFESVSDESIPELGMEAIRARIEESISQLQDQFESLSDRFMTAVFSFGQSSVFDPNQTPDASLLNFETQPDQEVIQAVERESLLDESFAGFTLATSQQFVDLIQANESNRELTMDQLVAQMSQIVETQEFRLRRIARSEAQKIVLTGREIGFNQLQEERPEEEFFYLWLITKDRRTSPQCLEIEKRVQALADSKNATGVSIDEFKEISVAVQQEMNGPRWTPTPYLPHPSCRSSLIRIV